MLIAFTVNHREIGQAEALAEWINELGGVKGHDVLLCLTRPAQRLEAEARIKPILARAFKSVSTFVPYDEVEIPWPNEARDARSPNHFFKRISQHVEWNLKRSFLWLEMDAVPLKSSWLDDLETAYDTCKRPFMGVRLEIGNIAYMSGVAVYPADITPHTSLLRNAGTAPFDVYAGKDIVQRAHFTKLIQYVRVNPAGPADWSVFKEPIREDAVLYHRSKDLSLIDYLRGILPTGNGVAGEPQTGLLVPIETPGRQTSTAPIVESELTISETIRFHCDAILEIAKSHSGRRQMVIAELRKRRLRK